MTNLVFDLNNIAFRSLFIVGGYGSKQYTFDSQDEVDQLVRKMAMDVSFITRIVNPSRIILTLDSKSWRKEINIEENEGYKSGRVKSKTINWENVFNAISDFAKTVENQGMIVTKIENAEADDIMALWRDELLFNQQQHVIIVSGDEDVRQLVQFNSIGENKMVFSTVYNPFMQGKNATRKLYVPRYFEEWVTSTDAVDIFNMKGSIDVDKDDFKKILSAEKTKMEYVEGRMIALRKIFCGDDGDDVPAFYTWLNEKGKEERITNSKFEKIYEALLNSPDELLNHADLFNRKDRLMKELTKVCKHTPPFKIEDRIVRQLKLVVLSPDIFPEQILKDFENAKTDALNKPRMNYGSSSMYNLLEGSKYVNERKTKGTEASIFGEIDKTIGKSLF